MMTEKNNTARNNFTADFFKNNRRLLAEKIQGGLVVLSAYNLLQKSGDMASPFLQEAHFWYLTGINEPNWQLIYDGSRDYAILVQPELSEVERIFSGEPVAESLLLSSGADEIVSEKSMESTLRKLARKHSTVYAILPDKQDFVLNPAPRKQWEKLERIFPKVLDCSSDLAKVRSIKQPQEIAAIQGAVDLTVQAFEQARSALADCRYEYELEAEFGYLFRKNNAEHAYDPIVAAGKNACTLHYGKNTDILHKNQPILCDIGARKNNYPADITRVFVKGKLKQEQQRLYDALAVAQRQIIELIKPGLPLVEYAKEVDNLLLVALREGGLVKGDTDRDVLYKYMPHAVSHGLGLDVHDKLGKPRYFEPGMVLTVEPGFYVPEKGYGFRIEDDILVTETGNSNLSAKLSTEVLSI